MNFDRERFDKEIGLHLQATRKRREMTQEELAAEIGIQRGSYANIEAGRQRIPIDIVWRAAVVLGVSISSLVPEPIPHGKQTSAKPALPGDTFSTSYNLSDLMLKVPVK
jgi:transcriptional regulator with XRE-family HTH domain